MATARLSEQYGKEDGILVEYMDHIFETDRTKPTTAYNYYMTLRSLAKFLKHRRGRLDCEPDEVVMSQVTAKEMANITQDEWWDYLDYIQFQEGETTNSLAVRISIIKGFYTWLDDVHQIAVPDCISNTKAPKAKRQPFIRISEDMERQLYENCEGAHTTRNICIIKLVLHCGLGLNEICALDLEDLDLTHVTVRNAKGRERRIPLDTETAEAVDTYITERIPPIDGSNALFVSAAKGRIRRGTVQKMFRKAVCAAGGPLLGMSLRDLQLTAKERFVQDIGADAALEFMNIDSLHYCRRVFANNNRERTSPD